jgi:hypothetical protein
MNRWCAYGEWDKIAEQAEIAAIRERITGNNTWKPNSFPRCAREQVSGGVMAIDFGCGLGRNVDLIASFATGGVIGVDIPEMIACLNKKDGVTAAKYKFLTPDLSKALFSGASVFYESVVFQHLEDDEEKRDIVNILNKSKVNVLFSLWNAAFVTNSKVYPKLDYFIQLLGNRWTIKLHYLDRESFPGTDHMLLCFKRS